MQPYHCRNSGRSGEIRVNSTLVKGKIDNILSDYSLYCRIVSIDTSQFSDVSLSMEFSLDTAFDVTERLS